jgi:hypothetical protein
VNEWVNGIPMEAYTQEAAFLLRSISPFVQELSEIIECVNDKIFYVPSLFGANALSWFSRMMVVEHVVQ